MGNDSKKKDTGNDETKETRASVDKGKSGGHGTVLIVAILLAIVGLGGLGAGGYFLFTQMKTAEAATEEGDSPEITETNIYFEEFPEGIVNLELTQTCGFTYLKYAFSLECENEEVKKEIEEKLPRLVASVAMVMSNRKWEEISTSNGREQLAREALAAINGQLSHGRCIGLYFTTFVAQ